MVILYFSLSRSGHNAVMNWICQQHDGRSFILRNPGHLKSFPAEEIKDAQNVEETINSLSEKDLLIIDFENREIGDIQFHENDILIKMAQKPIKNHCLISVIHNRDPYNLAASQLMHSINKSYPLAKVNHKGRLEASILYCKSYLNESLRRTRKISSNLVDLNFNKWSISKDYRKEMADCFCVPFTDKGFKEVAEMAGGSSFDGMRYSKKADKMELFSRWKKFKDNPIFQELILRDKEYEELTKSYFGLDILNETNIMNENL